MTFSGNNYDLGQCISTRLYGAELGSSVEYYGNSLLESPYQFTSSVDHDATAGAYKAWMKGGIVATQNTVYPTNKTFSYLLSPNSASIPCYTDFRVLVAPGATVTFNVWLRKSASMAYLPWIAIMDPRYDRIYKDGLTVPSGQIVTMTDSTDIWETGSIAVTNSTSFLKEYVIRVVCMNASGSVYALWEQQASATGGAGGASVIGSSIVKGCKA